MKHLILVGLAVCLLATVSYAQETPRVDVAVGYSPLYIIKGFTIWNNGVSGSVAVNANSWFGLAGDAGVYIGHVPERLTGETYMAGPRVTYRQLDRVVPYAQVLFGGSHFSESTGGITGEGSHFALAAGGGIDYLLGKNGKWSARVEGDYVGIESSGSLTPSARFVFGVAYHFGKK